MKIASRFYLGSLLAALLAAASAQAATGTATPEIAKPRLKSLTTPKANYQLDEPLALTVQFEGKQCVFNVEFKAADGTTKSQGYFFSDANQLSWAFSNPASYWGVGAGSYTVSAVPHANPKVAGATAPGCSGGPVTASLKIDAPVVIKPVVLPPTSKDGLGKPGEKQGAVDMFKPGEKQGAVDMFKPGEKPGAPIYMKPGETQGAPIFMKPGDEKGKAAPAGK